MKENKDENEIAINLDDMMKAGLHFGHRVSRINPKMKPYISGIKSTVHIIDLARTAEKLKEALKFIQDIISENKVLILIGTKIQIKEMTKQTAQDCGLMYVNNRWLGGTFTNFETIKKRIDYYKDLEKKKEAGELEKYTKKERAKFNKELNDLGIRFLGIKNLQKLPDAIFVLDMKKDILAVKEAKMKGVKVIAVAHTNVDPTLADYPIPANDDSVSSIKYILEKTKEAVLKARTQTQPQIQQ